MKVASPSRELHATCPCCGQGGLVLSSCPRCHHVLLICSETGTIFPEPYDLSLRLAQSFNDRPPCPACGGASLLEYENATCDEIKALGLAENDYK